MMKSIPVTALQSTKGYGTAAHIQALKELGPCPIHRRSFIKNFVAEGSRMNKEKQAAVMKMQAAAFLQSKGLRLLKRISAAAKGRLT